MLRASGPSPDKIQHLLEGQPAAAMANLTGEPGQGPLKLAFDRRLMQFGGFAVTSDVGLLAHRGSDQMVGVQI